MNKGTINNKTHKGMKNNEIKKPITHKENKIK